MRTPHGISQEISTSPLLCCQQILIPVFYCPPIYFSNHTTSNTVTLFSIAEAELLEFEFDSKGHIILSALCLLAVSRSGLREVELRQILADENQLLPDFIKRKGIGNPVGFSKH